MTAGQWWHHLSVWAARQGQPPSHVLVLGTGLLVAVLWQGSALREAVLGYALTWFLLFGGLRPVLELRRSRRQHPRTSNDADQLARLTGLPGGLWVGVFALVAAGALALGGWLLV